MRLSNDKRETMLAFAMKNSTNSELVKAEKKLISLNARCDSIAHNAVELRFPKTQMEILSEFKVTTTDSHWKFKPKNGGNADIVDYSLSEGADSFLVADSWELRRRVFEISKSDWNSISSCIELRKEVLKLENQIQSDFKNALYACNTFKQALEIWPKFSEIEEKICHRNLACVSDEVVERIGNYKVS